MSTPTPRTDETWASSFEPCEYRAAHTARTMRDECAKLERELAHEREASRLLKVAMDVREEGHTQSRRRMSVLESEVTAKVQAVRNLAEVISGQDKELEHERAKVRVLRDACESICEEWGRNHDANPIGAGQRMETLASKALEKLEDAQ